MELVQSYHQLNSFISEIRSLRKGFISNLFLHFEKHNLWIEKKELFYQATTEGYFIFRNNSMASYLFYITTDEFQLRKGLQEITPQIKKTVMVDILEDSKIESIKQVFFDNDFLLYEELNRMSRIGLCLIRFSRDWELHLQNRKIRLLFFSFYILILTLYPNRFQILKKLHIIYKTNGF